MITPLSFLLFARLFSTVAAVDAFPTQIFSAYNGASGSRLGAGGGRWSGGGAGGGGARVNDNAEVARHFDRFTTTTTVPPSEFFVGSCCMFSMEFELLGCLLLGMHKEIRMEFG